MSYLSKAFDRFSEWIADRLGKPVSFALAVSLVVIWAGFGPVTHFSETWQLIINTGTTIATFLMVFLLQNTQNRDDAQIRQQLQDIAKTQKTILGQQRRLAERLTEIQLSVDKQS